MTGQVAGAPRGGGSRENGPPEVPRHRSELLDVLVRVVAQWTSGAMMATVAVREGLDLETPEIVVLTVAWRHGPQRPSTIARHLSTGASNVSKILRRLEDRGLVERRVDPHDARASRIWLTEAGADVGRRLVSAGDGLVDELLDGWPDTERQDLARLLRKLEASTDSLADR